MRRTLQVLNDLELHGIISRYAIGGAVAALYYMEAVATEDLDIFIPVREHQNLLLPFEALNEELKRRGYSKDGIYDMIEGMPVQFLPAHPALVNEALLAAVRSTMMACRRGCFQRST